MCLVHLGDTIMHPIDYILIAVICLASVAIGIYTSCTGGRQKSTREYVMGDRNMRLLPVAISILVSFWSAISLLGSPAEIFYFGSFYNLTAVGISLACMVSAYTFVPLFYGLEITSIYEYLELRYENRFIRYWTTILYVLSSTLYLAVAQLAPAIAMEAVIGIPEWLGILIIGLISVVYTAMGGIKAVIWSDVFQSFFIFFGLVALIIKATLDSGGVSAVATTNSEWGRFKSLDWDQDPRVRLTVWGSTIGVMFGWIPWYGPNQASFQRFASLPTLRQARWSILLNILGVGLLFLLLSLTGYSIFAFYTIRGCDPYSEGAIKSVNQLLPHYVKHELNVVSLPGIIIACILSGAFSTTSTVLNSQAAVTVIDFVRPYRNLDDRKATLVTKWFVVAYGILGCAISFASSHITGVSLKQISGSLLNATTGASLGVYLLAALIPKSTWRGAFVGSLVSLVLVGWICIGSLSVTGGGAVALPLATNSCSNVTQRLNEKSDTLPSGLNGFYSISFQWYGFIGSISCLIVGALVSLPNILDPNADWPDEKYMLPFVTRLAKYFNSQSYNTVEITKRTYSNNNNNGSPQQKLEHNETTDL